VWHLPLLPLSCSSTYANELVSFVVIGTIVALSSLVILISYALILFNVIHMSLAKGWSKAMSTCGSHIITVGLFYGTGLLTHMKPSSADSVVQGKIFSVFYSFMVPMLNPLIYSLRNKNMKLALKRTLKRITKCVNHWDCRSTWPHCYFSLFPSLLHKHLSIYFFLSSLHLSTVCELFLLYYLLFSLRAKFMCMSILDLEIHSQSQGISKLIFVLCTKCRHWAVSFPIKVPTPIIFFLFIFSI
jgi:hypothetical protein